MGHLKSATHKLSALHSLSPNLELLMSEPYGVAEPNLYGDCNAAIRQTVKCKLLSWCRQAHYSSATTDPMFEVFVEIMAVKIRTPSMVRWVLLNTEKLSPN